MNVERGMMNERKPQRTPSRSSFIIHRSAFTVTELLIVIGIIVLALALAMPAFNFLTGSKSTEAAYNAIGAFLARARNEAIGNQQTRGVFFYMDPATDRIVMTIVQQVDSPANPLADVYLDLTADRDTMMLPKGVGIQFVDDRGTPGSAQENDRYIGFNRRNANTGAIDIPQDRPEYGGVILFNSLGMLITRTYAFKTHPGTGTSNYTNMGTLLYPVQPTDPYSSLYNDVVPVHPAMYPAKVLKSQLGFVLFESDAFTSRFGPDAWNDQQIINPAANYIGSTEQAEEAWLDENAMPVLMNRYTGMLVKGE